MPKERYRPDVALECANAQLQVGALRYDLQGRRESAAFEYGAGWLGEPAHFALGPTRDYIKRRQESRLEGKEEEAPPLIELGHLLSASHAVEAKKETAADLAYLRGRGTSLGGMSPKCTVTDDDGALSIGKFPSIADERAVTKGEVLALTLARKAGINAAAARIVQSEDLPVALIRRFDRRGNGHRVMYVSAAAMLAAEVTEPEEHTYTEIVGRNPRARGRRTNRYRRIVAAYCLHDSDYQC